MKQFLKIAFLALILLLVISCQGDGTEPAAQSGSDGIFVENAFYYTHVNGHSEETQTPAYVLFEYELLDRIRYQVAYIACTCRGAEVNYWSVAFIELSKEDGSVLTLSYDKDSNPDGDGHYTAGLYGDSYVTWDGIEAYNLFYEQFIPNQLLGATQAAINSMEPMHGEVDAYTGATVTPNNAVRMLQGLFTYHNTNYMNS